MIYQARNKALGKNSRQMLNYVALGDSYAWGFPHLYAAHIETDLGVHVQLNDWVQGGQSSSELLENLRGNQNLRSALTDAEVITFMVPMALFKDPSIDYIEKYSMEMDDQDGMMDAFALYQQDTDAIFYELLALQKSSDIILRVMDCYLPAFLFTEWNRSGGYQQLKTWWQEFNEHVIQTACKHEIPMANVRLAFNGSSGDVNPTEYIEEDGWHVNERGAALIAALHRQLGYAPLV